MAEEISKPVWTHFSGLVDSGQSYILTGNNWWKAGDYATWRDQQATYCSYRELDVVPIRHQPSIHLIYIYPTSQHYDTVKPMRDCPHIMKKVLLHNWFIYNIVFPPKPSLVASFTTNTFTWNMLMLNEVTHCYCYKVMPSMWQTYGQ